MIVEAIESQYVGLPDPRFIPEPLHQGKLLMAAILRDLRKAEEALE